MLDFVNQFKAVFKKQFNLFILENSAIFQRLMVQNKLIFQKYYFMKKLKRLHTYNRSMNSIIIIPVIAFSSGTKWLNFHLGSWALRKDYF